MDLNASHAGFVIAAYAVSGAVIVFLCAWVIVRDRQLRRQLDARQGTRQDHD